MKKKNKKGFFLSETMVVIAIVSVVLLTVFKIFSSVYIKYKESENYNTVNATNAVVELRKFYQATEFDYNTLLNGSYYVDLTNSTEYDGEYYENLKQVLKVDKVYLINMAAVFNGTNINVFNTSLRKYLKTMQGTESTVMLVAVTDGNQYGSVTVVGGEGAAPALVGDSTNEYEVIVPLNGTFTDPGYTNWFGDAPTTSWETTLNTAVEGTYYLKYNFDGFLLRRKVIVAKATYNYEYNGSVQIFVVPVTGYYFIELYGAQGGESLYSVNYNGGNGGYTSGYVSLTKGETLYIYVGGKGQKSTGTGTGVLTINGNGYNGGGYAAFAPNNSDKGGGGGATDIRFFGSTTPTSSDLSWNSTLGLNSRIMVAGGGGGSSSHVSTPSYSGTGGQGGSLVGGKGIYVNGTCYAYGTGGTQVAGGGTPPCPSDGQTYTGNGAFGIGNTPYTVYNTNGATAGGGGGYYGGGGGYHAPAGGGSSFISGYAGSNAITSSSSTTATNNTKHYSGKYFINGNMISGANTGHGKANITYYGIDAPTKTNTKLNNVRYVKDCINGSSGDSDNHWVELQAIYQGTNIVKGKTVTGTVVESTGSPYSRIVDGDITSANLAHGVTYTGLQCVTVDLGQTYNLDEIAVWHYWADGRTYYSNTTYVSSDNSTWTSVIANTDKETSQGKRINAYSNYYFYTGSSQTFTVPQNGYYKIEAWGASGGNADSIYIGGMGGYTSGRIYLTTGTNLYLYVGGAGISGCTTGLCLGGYNGGGKGGYYTSGGIYQGSGGGSTDIRYGGTTLNDRIMIAAGGGGGSNYPSYWNGSGGAGGGLSGTNANYGGGSGSSTYPGLGGTQTAGGTAANCVAGTFGNGGTRDSAPLAGGGGGYYGGGCGWGAGGGGGSSYISGYTGSVAIVSSSSTSPRTGTSGATCSQGGTDNLCSIHYSGKYFSETSMFSGVNLGNGFVKITYLSS